MCMAITTTTTTTTTVCSCLESPTSHCICIGNRCRYPPFGACTGPEASCTAFAQYLGRFTVGWRKSMPAITLTTMPTHSVDEPSGMFASSGIMRRHPHFCLCRDLWCRWLAWLPECKDWMEGTAALLSEYLTCNLIGTLLRVLYWLFAFKLGDS